MLKTCVNKSHPNWAKFLEVSSGNVLVATSLWNKYKGDFDLFSEQQRSKIEKQLDYKYAKFLSATKDFDDVDYFDAISKEFSNETKIANNGSIYFSFSETDVQHLIGKRSAIRVVTDSNGNSYAVLKPNDSDLSSIDEHTGGAFVESSYIESFDKANGLEAVDALLANGEISMSDKIILNLLRTNYSDLLKEYNVVVDSRNNPTMVNISFRNKTIYLNRQKLNGKDTNSFISAVTEDLSHAIIQKNMESSPALVKRLTDIVSTSRDVFINQKFTKDQVKEIKAMFKNKSYTSVFDAITDYFNAYRQVTDITKYTNPEMIRMYNEFNNKGSVSSFDVRQQGAFKILSSIVEANKALLYPMTNVIEFAYHVTKSKKLQEHVNKIQANKNETLMDKFINWFYDALKLDKIYSKNITQGSVLKEALVISFGLMSKEGTVNKAMEKFYSSTSNQVSKNARETNNIDDLSSIVDTIEFVATTAAWWAGYTASAFIVLKSLVYIEQNTRFRLFNTIGNFINRKLGGYDFYKNIKRNFIEDKPLGDIAKKSIEDTLANKLKDVEFAIRKDKRILEDKVTADQKALDKLDTDIGNLMIANTAVSTAVRTEQARLRSDIAINKAEIEQLNLDIIETMNVIDSIRTEVIPNLDKLINLAELTITKLVDDNYKLLPNLINTSNDYHRNQVMLKTLISVMGEITNEKSALMNSIHGVPIALPADLRTQMLLMSGRLEIVSKALVGELPRLLQNAADSFDSPTERSRIGDGFASLLDDNGNLINNIDDINLFNKYVLTLDRPGNPIVQLAGVMKNKVNGFIEEDITKALTYLEELHSEFSNKYHNRKVRMFDMFRQTYIEDNEDGTQTEVLTNRLINKVSIAYYNRRNQLKAKFRDESAAERDSYEAEISVPNNNFVKPKAKDRMSFKNLVEYVTFLADSIDIVDDTSGTFGMFSNVVQNGTESVTDDKMNGLDNFIRSLEMSYDDKIDEARYQGDYLLEADLIKQKKDDVERYNVRRFIKIMNMVRNNNRTNAKGFRDISLEEAFFIHRFKGWGFVNTDVNENFLVREGLYDQKYRELLDRGLDSIEVKYYKEFLKLKIMTDSMFPSRAKLDGTKISSYDLGEFAKDVAEEMTYNDVTGNRGRVAKGVANIVDGIIRMGTENINENVDVNFDAITGEPLMSIYVPYVTGTADLNDISNDLTHVITMQTKLAINYYYKNKYEATFNNIVDLLKNYENVDKKALTNSIDKLATANMSWLYGKSRDLSSAKTGRFGDKKVLTRRDQITFDRYMKAYSGLETALQIETAKQLARNVPDFRYADEIKLKQDAVARKVNNIGRAFTVEALLDLTTQYTRVVGLGLRFTSATFDFIYGYISNFSYFNGNDKRFTERSLIHSYMLAMKAVMIDTFDDIRDITQNRKPNSSRVTRLAEMFGVDKDMIAAASYEKHVYVSRRERVVGSMVSMDKLMYVFMSFSGRMNVYGTMVHHLKTVFIDTERGRVNIMQATEDELTAMNTNDVGDIRNDVLDLLHKIHGTLINDSVQISRTAAGRALMIFRSWMPDALDVTWGKERTDILGGKFIGKATSLRRVFSSKTRGNRWRIAQQAVLPSRDTDKDFVLGLIARFPAITNTNGVVTTPAIVLDVEDIKNLRRIVNQIVITSFLLFLGSLAVKNKDDDETEEYLRTTQANAVQRLLRDMNWLFDFEETQKIVNVNLFPSLHSIVSFIDYYRTLSKYSKKTDMWYDAGDKNPILKKPSPYAGYDRRWIELGKLIPGVSGAMGTATYGKRRTDVQNNKF